MIRWTILNIRRILFHPEDIEKSLNFVRCFPDFANSFMGVIAMTTCILGFKLKSMHEPLFFIAPSFIANADQRVE